MPESLADLEAQIRKLEGEYQIELKKQQETKRRKELKQKLLRLKYRRQLALADRAGRATSTGIKSLVKFGTKALKAVNKYAAHLDSLDEAAKNKAKK